MYIQQRTRTFQMLTFRIFVVGDLNANFLHIKPKSDLRNLKQRSKELSFLVRSGASE
jgi:hypothetical protein